MLYCVVPGGLGRRLRTNLERHFRDDPDVTVVVDRREGDRRRPDDRRAGTVAAWSADARRRQVHNATGRRVVDRRAVMVAALEHPELPRALRRHAGELQFAVRIEPSERSAEDAESARLAVRAQQGDPDAFREIYLRYFDAVYAYMRLALQSVHDVEYGLQCTFRKVLGDLPTHRIDSMPFAVWIGSLLFGHAPDRDDDAARLADDGLPQASNAEALDLLEWLTDDDLRMLMERLPAFERETVGLCYILDLSAREIATIAAVSVEDVERAHGRAIRFMGRCLASLARRPGYSGRHPIKAPPRPEIVMRRRRLALTGG
jgi:DNA-directed RNA polymerase specialized sigma24 family protein